MEDQEVDFQRVVQFALLGSSDLEQYAILLVRVSLGLFFAISGANKLFVAGGAKAIYETLVKAKVPFPHLMAYFVSGVEFVCGSIRGSRIPRSMGRTDGHIIAPRENSLTTRTEINVTRLSRSRTV